MPREVVTSSRGRSAPIQMLDRIRSATATVDLVISSAAVSGSSAGLTRARVAPGGCIGGALRQSVGSSWLRTPPFSGLHAAAAGCHDGARLLPRHTHAGANIDRRHQHYCFVARPGLWFELPLQSRSEAKQKCAVGAVPQQQQARFGELAGVGGSWRWISRTDSVNSTIPCRRVAVMADGPTRCRSVGIRGGARPRPAPRSDNGWPKRRLRR